MGTIDQATGNYKCDRCGKEIEGHDQWVCGSLSLDGPPPTLCYLCFLDECNHILDKSFKKVIESAMSDWAKVVFGK